MFATAYASSWQHPGIAFLGAPLVLLGAWLFRREMRRGMVALLVLLETIALLDAWLSGGLTPLSPAHVTIAVSAFVVLGDLRFFYLVERQRTPSIERAILFALPLSLVVPFTTGLVHTLRPALLSDTRLFLVYEASMVLVVLAYGRMRSTSAYTRRLVGFEVVQYALWACADALILAGRDEGFLLRVVPNALYYVGFVPVATLRVPADVRA